MASPSVSISVTSARLGGLSWLTKTVVLRVCFAPHVKFAFRIAHFASPAHLENLKFDTWHNLNSEVHGVNHRRLVTLFPESQGVLERVGPIIMTKSDCAPFLGRAE